MAITEHGLEAPPAVLVRRRWVKMGKVEWAQQADEIMLAHGVVYGTGVYEKRHQARWRARKLIDLLVTLELRERWELEEHVNRRGSGWGWCVEYKGKGTHGV